MEVIVPTREVKLQRFGGLGAPSVAAYTGVVSFTTSKAQSGPDGGGGGSGGGGRIPVPVDGSATAPSLEGPRRSRSTCHYLMVRLGAQEADLLVFFNVPHDEFDSSGDPRGLSREEELGSETIRRLVDGLEVRDWGLFL